MDAGSDRVGGANVAVRRAVARMLGAAVLVGLLALVPAAIGAKRKSTLWATVNICDTPRHPNRAGFRAQMPGNGSSQRMFMRFRAQYYYEPRKAWYDVNGKPLSPWIYVGTARSRTRQGGYTFSFDRPPKGKRHLIRGVVYFNWRQRNRQGKVETVRRARRITEGGHRGTTDSDPRGYSSATCAIRH
jgi:hypothetical protein